VQRQQVLLLLVPVIQLQVQVEALQELQPVLPGLALMQQHRQR
jgi:hypothetical protein